jgi:hypothetical protein
VDRLLGFAQLQMQVVQHSELCFENLLFHLITNHFFRNCGVCDKEMSARIDNLLIIIFYLPFVTVPSFSGRSWLLAHTGASRNAAPRRLCARMLKSGLTGRLKQKNQVESIMQLKRMDEEPNTKEFRDGIMA